MEGMFREMPRGEILAQRGQVCPRLQLQEDREKGGSVALRLSTSRQENGVVRVYALI